MCICMYVCIYVQFPVQKVWGLYHTHTDNDFVSVFLTYCKYRNIQCENKVIWKSKSAA